VALDWRGRLLVSSAGTAAVSAAAVVIVIVIRGVLLDQELHRSFYSPDPNVWLNSDPPHFAVVAGGYWDIYYRDRV
jgi:hypothetical protein